MERHSGLAVGAERAEIVLLGSAATCTIDFLTQQVRLQTPDQTEAQVVNSVGGDWQVERDFIAAVRSAQHGETWHISPDFAEASHYMLKLQALHDSSVAGSFVKLAEIARPPVA